MYALKDFHIDNLNTSKATDISYMFNYAQSLEILNLSGWNTSNVTNMN
jgi:surface protein